MEIVKKIAEKLAFFILVLSLFVWILNAVMK